MIYGVVLLLLVSVAGLIKGEPCVFRLARELSIEPNRFYAGDIVNGFSPVHYSRQGYLVANVSPVVCCVSSGREGLYTACH